MVGGHDHERVVIEPGVAEALEDLPDQLIAVLGLEQVLLLADRARPGAPGEHELLAVLLGQAHPERIVDVVLRAVWIPLERLVRDHQVQVVEGGTLVGVERVDQRLRCAPR